MKLTYSMSVTLEVHNPGAVKLAAIAATRVTDWADDESRVGAIADIVIDVSYAVAELICPEAAAEGIQASR